MKKIVFVMATLLAVGGLLSAQEIKDLKFGVNGSITSSYGFDLDTNDNGFKLSNDLIFTLGGPGSDIKKTGQGVYGEVAVNGIHLGLENYQDELSDGTALRKEGGIADEKWWETWDWGTTVVPTTVSVVDATAPATGYTVTYPTTTKVAGSKVSLFDNTRYNGQSAVMASVGNVTAKLVLNDLTISLKNAYEGNGWKDNLAERFTGDSNNQRLTNAYSYRIYDGKYGKGSNAAASFSNDWNGDGRIYFRSNPTDQQVAQNDGTGIGVKYSISQVADIGFNLATNDGWTDGVFSGLNLGFGFDVKAVENLTLAGSVFMDKTGKLGYTAPVEFGGKVGYTAKLGEGMTITPMVAVDVLDQASTAGNLAGGITIDIAKVVVVANVAKGLGGLNVRDHLNYTISMNMKAVDNLILQAAYEAEDLSTAPATQALHAKLGYKIGVSEKGSITPSAQLSYDTKSTTAGEIYAKVEIKADNVLENTAIYLNWDSNELTASTNKLGQLVLGVELGF